ncbi:MAG: quinohemoprotein amine dehydrogenase maturation protein [Rhodocyclaceae bacterium]|nr:quinohemoprotein amine dehydrogenase maturation protein [Rhodocyclaceae bacterium]
MTYGTLELVRPNLHRVDVDARTMLFHVPSSALFELDGVSRDLIGLLERDGVEDAGRVHELLVPQYGRAAVAEAVDELLSLEILVERGGHARLNPEPRPVTRFPLTTLVLNVNTGCNLSCSYCYKEDLATPARGQRMTRETAQRAIEMLLRESPGQPRYNLVFFGGEPLTNIELIRDIVDWSEPRFAAAGAKVDFTLTTNATLLNEALIDWFNAHRFGLTVSMDGPRALHDRNRRTVGGQGTYDVVRRKVDMLLASYTARPVGCRVTLTRGVSDVEAIFDHLHREVGFHEVGFGPVSSGDIAAFNLPPDELATVFAGLRRLGHRYLDAALAGRSLGFANLHQLLGDLHAGNKKMLPCGAGVALLAVDHEGGLNLCHRFTGSGLPRFGDVDQGIDRPRLAAFIEKRLDRSGTGCQTCRIRNLCSGGCYHESHARYGDAAHPAYHYCDLLREWIDFGIGIYARIAEASPAYFETHITPRKGA